MLLHRWRLNDIHFMEMVLQSARLLERLHNISLTLRNRVMKMSYNQRVAETECPQLKAEVYLEYSVQICAHGRHRCHSQFSGGS